MFIACKDVREMGRRLMAGHGILVPIIGVRIPAPQFE